MSNVQLINFRSHQSGRKALREGEEPTIELPAPALTRSKSIMRALQSRRSSREFSTRSIPMQILSNLLWAAQGVNRSATDGRTTPSTNDWKEILIFVAKADGLFLYEPRWHALRRNSDKDVRAATGLEPFVAGAPLNLVYVADFDAMTEASDPDRILFSGADAGFIAQSVYLYCASAGLATVVRGMIDRAALARTMALPSSHRIILAQTVGYCPGTA